MPVAATVRASRGGDFCIVSADAVADALEQAYCEWKAGALRARTRVGFDFALGHPWERTATQLLEAIRRPVLPRRARGEPIASHVRVQARALAQRFPGATAVVKIGGLSDMLQLTAVITAQYKSVGSGQAPMVLFTNGWPEVFERLPGVVEHCLIPAMPQDIAVRSIADEFETCLDVRYVSRISRRGREPESHPNDWYMDHWPGSSNRLQNLGTHTTALMLESLELVGGVVPTYLPREPAPLEITEPAVAICTGADHRLKAWPMSAWQELVSALIADMIMVIQVGGPGDPLVAGVHDARGGTLASTASILEQVDHLVTHDNAMAHLAASVALKTSVIVGPVAPRMFGYPGHVALGQSVCPPCFWLEPTWSQEVCAAGVAECLNFPDVTEVMLAVRDALSAVGVVANGHVNR